MGGMSEKPGARRRRRSEPESSVALRVVVLAITMVPVAATAAEGALSPATAVASLALIPLGSWMSHRRRALKNVGLKLFLAAALLAALGEFLARVRYSTSVDEARVPLASLFVWVQVIHSFDLPRRRDLAFSVAAAVALMAEAASLSMDGGFGLFLVPFAALAGTWLYLSDRASRQEEGSDATFLHRRSPERAPATRGAVRAAVTSLGVVAVAIAVVFTLTPRLPGALVLAPPFSLANRVDLPGFAGEVVNPLLPTGSGVQGQPGAVRGVGYPGFGQAVDLRVRGELSDDVVMRVRSPRAAFWRGQSYDRFDGTTWTSSSSEPTEVSQGYEPPIELPEFDPPGIAATEELVQTFYVEREQPNIVFGAYRAHELYFPTGRVAVDSDGSIRAPILLEPETIYSVVSRVPVTTPALLRSPQPPAPQPTLDRYTQLPPELPARVRSLAHRITDSQPTVYDKVMAVQRWLQTNTRYRLDIPRDPPGVDAVDWFLFETREGFCEHIASAMVVLLRAVGIPARFVVGFDAGDRNLLSGYFEVRQSDAHAWVEVYYPGVAWVEYDPTHEVPAAAPSASDWFIAPKVIAAIGRFLGWLVPQPVDAALGALVSAIARSGALALRWWPAAAVTLAFASVVVVWMSRARRRRRRGPPATGAAAAFQSMCQTFEARGVPRSSATTPSEHLLALVRADPVARAERGQVELIVRTFERERFSGNPPGDEEIEAALAAAGRLSASAVRGTGNSRKAEGVHIL